MRPYQALRKELCINGIGYTELARSLRVSAGTISRKMNGQSEWTLDECYRTLDLLCKPHSDLTNYFPYKGRNEEDAPCRKSRTKG